MSELTQMVTCSKMNTHGIQDVEILTKSTQEVKPYRMKNGTYYHATTSDQVINALERCRLSDCRYTLDLGDVKTCISWNEEHDITGYVSRSMGEVKIPILVSNRRSLGGGGILDHCILLIKHANKANGGTVYKNPKYRV